MKNDALTLAKWLSGDFSNKSQAYANPPFFAHIRLCIMPLPFDSLDGEGRALFVAQSYNYRLNRPYRQRILRIVPREQHLEIETYHIPVPDEVDPRHQRSLHQLDVDEVTKVDGCNMIVERLDDGGFNGEIPRKTCLTRDTGDTKEYLESRMTVYSNDLYTLDRGRDSETGQRTWGSVAGFFHFKPLEDYAELV